MLIRYWFTQFSFQRSQFMPHNMVYMMARKMISMTSLISVVRKLREKEIAVIGNTSQLVTWVWSIKSSTQLFFLRRNHKKFFERYKNLPNEKYITQQKALLWDFKIQKLKDTTRKFISRRKIWKLHEGSLKKDFKLHISTSTKQGVKKMLLLKVIGMFWKELY